VPINRFQSLGLIALGRKKIQTAEPSLYTRFRR